MASRPGALLVLMVAVAGVALADLLPLSRTPSAAAQTSGDEGRWHEVQSLTSDDPTFGELLAINGDLLVVGGDQFPLAVFEPGASGEWAPTGSISPPAGFEYGTETQPTAIATDGISVVVGGETGAWLFQRAADGLWEQRAWLAIPSTGTVLDEVRSVAVGGDLAVVATSSNVYAFGAVEDGVANWGRLDRDWETRGRAVAVDGLAILMTADGGFVYAVRRAQVPACRTALPPIDGCYAFAGTVSHGFGLSGDSVGLVASDGLVVVGIRGGPPTSRQAFIGQFNPDHRPATYEGTVVALPAGATASQLAISGDDVLVGGRLVSEPVVFALSSADAFSTPQVLRPGPFTALAASQGALAVGGGGSVTLFRPVDPVETTPESPTPSAAAPGTPEPSPTTVPPTANGDDATPTSSANNAAPPEASAEATADNGSEAESTATPGSEPSADGTASSGQTPVAADSQGEDGDEGDGAPILQIMLVAVGLLVVLALGALGGYVMRARASR